MFCAISGNVPEQPVVSAKGHLYERRLIEKYVAETGKCPITGESLSAEDLKPIVAGRAVKPRTAPAASIPGLLGLFHDEWDALMLETHALRQSLHASRQELSLALYQQDAAARVIARLIRERDEARAELASAREGGAGAAPAAKRGADAAEEAPAKRARGADELPAEALEELAAVSAALSKGRKKRAVPPTVATPEDVAAYALRGAHALHKTTQGGINALDLHPRNPNIVATAGNDATVMLFDVAAAREVGALKGHGKKVTSVQFASPEVLLSASVDKSAIIWRSADGGASFSKAASLSHHGGEVVAVSVHPGGHYFVTAGADKAWAFCDLATATCLKKVTEDMPEGYTCARFHPDGMILGTGAGDGVVRIFEVRGQTKAATFEGHAGPVRSIAFSENGYYAATASAEAVKLWDLRKLKCFSTLAPYADAKGPGAASVEFDHSGLYLAVGGADARVYGAKQEWAVVKTFAEVPKKGVTALRWGPDARSLLVGGGDHNLRVFGAPQ